jgi:hypothetical protein
VIRRAPHSNQHHLGDVDAEFLELFLRLFDRASSDLGVAPPRSRIVGRSVLAAAVKSDARIMLQIREFDGRGHHPDEHLSIRKLHLDATDAG